MDWMLRIEDVEGEGEREGWRWWWKPNGVGWRGRGWRIRGERP